MWQKIKSFFTDKPGWSIMCAIFIFIAVYIWITGHGPFDFLEDSPVANTVVVVLSLMIGAGILYIIIRGLINWIKSFKNEDL